METKQTEGVAADVLAVREINLGTYAFDPGALLDSLAEVAEQGGERYLTDAIRALHESRAKLATVRTNDADVALGVNDRSDLMTAESVAQRRILERHALAGVTFLHPETFGSSMGRDRLDTSVAAGVACSARPRSARAARSVRSRRSATRGWSAARASSIPTSSRPRCSRGQRGSVRPSAPRDRHRPRRQGRDLCRGEELERRRGREGAAPLLPRGRRRRRASNLGAGTITANYDGRRKHRTTLGKSVKTGIHTSLVAPLDVGDGAYTGAGSVITDDVPDGALGVARSKQRNVEGYAQRVEDPE